jgi:hypothetical protein
VRATPHPRLLPRRMTQQQTGGDATPLAAKMRGER